MLSPKRLLPAVAMSALVLAGATAVLAEDEPANKTPITLKEIMAAFRKIPGMEAKFTEEKLIDMLDKPLVNHGTVHYFPGPPTMMVRHTNKPGVSSVMINGNALSMGDEDKTERLDKKKNPVAFEFVDAFISFLKGDEHAMKRLYEIRFRVQSGKPRGWTLNLRPAKYSAVKDLIAAVVFQGTELKVEMMTIMEANGDRTTTKFRDIDVKRQYSDRDLERVFSMPSERLQAGKKARKDKKKKKKKR